MNENVTNETLRKLAEPFHPDKVSWEPMEITGSRAKAQPYISAFTVQETLDEIVGPGNWETSYHPSPIVEGVLCRIRIKVNGEWVSREDISSSCTDALRTAAKQWGIGRYLTRYSPAMVDLDDKKGFKHPNTLPAEFLPKGFVSSESPVPSKETAAPKAAATPVVPVATKEPDVVNKAEPAKMAPPAVVEPAQEAVPAPVEDAGYGEPADEPAAAPAASGESVPMPTNLTDTQKKATENILGRIEKGTPGLESILKHVLGASCTNIIGPDAKKYLLSVIKAKSDEKGLNLTVPSA